MTDGDFIGHVWGKRIIATQCVVPDGWLRCGLCNGRIKKGATIGWNTYADRDSRRWLHLYCVQAMQVGGWEGIEPMLLDEEAIR